MVGYLPSDPEARVRILPAEVFSAEVGRTFQDRISGFLDILAKVKDSESELEGEDGRAGSGRRRRSGRKGGGVGEFRARHCKSDPFPRGGSVQPPVFSVGKKTPNCT